MHRTPKLRDFISIKDHGTCWGMRKNGMRCGISTRKKSEIISSYLEILRLIRMFASFNNHPGLVQNFRNILYIQKRILGKLSVSIMCHRHAKLGSDKACLRRWIKETKAVFSTIHAAIRSPPSELPSLRGSIDLNALKSIKTKLVSTDPTLPLQCLSSTSGVRCTYSINCNFQQRAGDLLERLQDSKLSNADKIELVEELAFVTHCRQVHRGRTSESLARLWLLDLNISNAEEDSAVPSDDHTDSKNEGSPDSDAPGTLCGILAGPSSARDTATTPQTSSSVITDIPPTPIRTSAYEEETPESVHTPVWSDQPPRRFQSPVSPLSSSEDEYGLFEDSPTARITTRRSLRRERFEPPTPLSQFVPFREPLLTKQKIHDGIVKILAKNDYRDQKKGSVYILRRESSPNHVKVGKSVGIVKERIKTQGRSCNYTPLDTGDGYKTHCPRRLEALVHADLTNWRRKERCNAGKGCTSVEFHTEWFELSADIVEKTILRWQNWLERPDIWDLGRKMITFSWKEKVHDLHMLLDTDWVEDTWSEWVERKLVNPDAPVNETDLPTYDTGSDTESFESTTEVEMSKTTSEHERSESLQLNFVDVLLALVSSLSTETIAYIVCLIGYSIGFWILGRSLESDV